MSRARIDMGKLGEDLALKQMRRLGYKQIFRNYRCPLGEVDFIAMDGDTLVFVEVKTRRGSSFGSAKDAVDGRKKRQLSKVALSYMNTTGRWDTRARFDVIAVHLVEGKAEIEVIKNAFDLAY